MERVVVRQPFSQGLLHCFIHKEEKNEKPQQQRTFLSSFNGRVGQEVTFTETFNLISDGSAPNFLSRADAHVTIHPDGTVTSFHDNFSSEC